MKKFTIILAAAVALLGGRAIAADYMNLAGRITGTNSFSAAAYSGLNASGNFTTAVGNNSLRESSQDNGVAIGCMTLANAKDGNLNTMVGTWAGFGSTNLVNCVGIGSGAFMGANNVTNGTSVNGQFCARGDLNRFWITPDKKSTADWDGCPPIYYDDGVLYLNARTIVKREGVVEKRAPLHRTDWGASIPHAMYVARYGRDEYDGLSMYYPKRTLQAALTALSDDETTIYVGEGSGDSREYLNRDVSAVEHRVHIVGVGKPEDVVIDCGGVRKLDAGKSGYLAVFENVTIRNVSTPTAGASSNHRGALQLFYLYNCRVVGTVTVRNSYWPFVAGFLERTDVDVVVDTDGTAANFSLGYGTVFSRVNAYDCKMKFSAGTGTAYPNMAYGLYAENCYIDFDRLYDYRITSVTSADGTRGGFHDCTFVVRDGTYASSIANSSGDCVNLLYGLNDTAPTFSKASYATSATNLLARLDAETHRPAPADYELAPFGYDSAADRAIRDGAVLTVMDILQSAGSLSAAQSAALLAAKPAIIARNARSTASRNRNVQLVADGARDE